MLCILAMARSSILQSHGMQWATPLAMEWLCLIHSFALSETMTVCIDDSTRSIAINIFIAACQY